MILIYVDDMIVIGSNVKVISSLVVDLNCVFMMKDLGPLSYFLGVEAHRTVKGLYLCQSNT